MYVSCDTGARPCNYLAVAKCEYMFVALGQPCPTIFFPHYIVNGTNFRKKERKKLTGVNMCLIFSKTFILDKLSEI